MRRTLPSLGLVTAIALLLVACGGDDTLSDQEYFDALGDVAAAAQEQDQALDEAFSFGEEEPDAETVAAFLETFQATFIEARAAVAALAAPRDLALAHAENVAAFDAVIEQFDRARAEAETLTDALAFFVTAAAVFDEFARTCAALEQLAVDRGIAVELFCGDQ